MSRVGRVVLAALVGLGAGPLAAQTPPSNVPFVYLNSQQILTEAPGSAEAQRTFERELSEMQTELQSRAAVLDSLVRDFQRQEVLLSPQAKEEKQADIRTRQGELQARRSELDNRARQRQQELLKPILDRVGSLIEELRQEHGWALVFDAAAEGVVAADPALDVTRIVLDRLRAGGGAAAETPAAGGGQNSPDGSGRASQD